MLGSVILFTLCVYRASGQADPPAPEVFLAEFLTDISPDPITIEVGASIVLQSSVAAWLGDQVPGTTRG